MAGVLLEVRSAQESRSAALRVSPPALLVAIAAPLAGFVILAVAVLAAGPGQPSDGAALAWKGSHLEDVKHVLPHAHNFAAGVAAR